MTVDGLAAGRVETPDTVQQLSDLLAQEKGSVVPIGGATQLHYGNPLRSFDCAADLTRLNRVTEYVPADLTIHVEAGMRFDSLTNLLAENNQILPLDPWNGADATIGGIAATNAQGPFRATGTIRDWIIGMKVVEADGRISKTGGRVVKNVTGYDLAKLYTGSIGTLAIIAEISLKVRAKFGKTATAIAQFENAGAAAKVITKIQTSPLAPVACEWIGPKNEIWLRFGEHPKAVHWQLKNLPAADWRIVEDGEETQAWESLRERYANLGNIVAKVITLPTEVSRVIEEFKPDTWLAHASTGIVYVAITNPADIARIRKSYRAVIERAPIELRQLIPTFGLNTAESNLMMKMKRAFDPDRRLNPGRHVDGELS